MHLKSWHLISILALTVFIRDLGMIPYVKIFLDVEQFRSPALCILEQLSEVNPEEYMSTAIGAICSSTESELRLKQDLLQVFTQLLLFIFGSPTSSVTYTYCKHHYAFPWIFRSSWLGLFFSIIYYACANIEIQVTICYSKT